MPGPRPCPLPDLAACLERCSPLGARCPRLPRAAQRRAHSLPPAGVENAFYEGPLRLRLPVAMQLDPDGAFSFELPLPSPEGNLSQVRFGARQAAGGL